MGPVSRAAIIKRQEAEERFFGAMIEELQGIRSALNTLTGRNALEIESVNERIDQAENRIVELERSA
jgi:hypothetical protein